MSFHLFTFPPFYFSAIDYRPEVQPPLRSRSRAHRTLLTETSAITLASVYRFELRLLSRRDEVSVFFKIFDDLFADHFAFESAQCAFDRFVCIDRNISHFLSHLLSAEDPPSRANYN